MNFQESNISIVRNQGQDRAVVFLHGFTGKQNDTWDRFPILLQNSNPEWDIFTIGYATTLQPDVVGIWSADPDLPILSNLLNTSLLDPTLAGYKSLALVGHSMGGLVVQRALVDYPDLAQRVRNVILFGTPSGGLNKANWLFFWKRQLQNMAVGSGFMTDLRSRWKTTFVPKSAFNLLVVAGASDQFVPPESSLGPFDKSVQRVVPGNHIEIVKPADGHSPSVNLVAAALKAAGTPTMDAASQLRVAAEQPTARATEIVQQVEASAVEMTVKMIVDSALALERAGKRPEAIALLEKYKEKGTDIQGTLGGRLKRLWQENGQKDFGERALSLYQNALGTALTTKNSDQIYYLAINVAFMKLVFSDDLISAQEMAALAMQHATPAGNDVWKTATVAEAHLYLGQVDQALAEYRRLSSLLAEPWQIGSASLQAGRIALKLNNQDLAEKLEAIFTPGAKKVNRIFVSYSHKDKDWLERFKVMIAPYLRAAETELDLWDDTKLQAGQQWDTEIKNALKCAGVAVALVSSDFLASTYVTSNELPVMIKAADEGGVRLLWVYLSAAGWEETPLSRFQAAHNTALPLDALSKSEQELVLKSIAQQVKAAALSATKAFVNQPLAGPKAMGAA